MFKRGGRLGRVGAGGEGGSRAAGYPHPIPGSGVPVFGHTRRIAVAGAGGCQQVTQGRHLVRKVVGSFWGVTGTMFGCRLWIDKDRSLVCAIGFSGEAGGVATGAVVTRLTMAGEKSGSLTASFSKAVSTFPAVVTGGSLVAIDAEGKKILVMALTSEALVPQAVDLSFLVGVEGGAVSMLSPAKLASGFGLGVGGRSVLVRVGEGGSGKYGPRTKK